MNRENFMKIWKKYAVPVLHGAKRTVIVKYEITVKDLDNFLEELDDEDIPSFAEDLE